MTTYLIQASYTALGFSGLIQSPEDRSGMVRSLVEGLGGTLESFYYAFGDHDVVEIVELPDSVSMAAFSMALGASGAVTNVKTTVLIPVNEGVEAARKAGSIGYRPPGS